MRVTFNMMSLKYIKNLQDSLAKVSDAMIRSYRVKSYST